MQQLTKKNFLGIGGVHTYTDNKTGAFINVPCSQEEYEALSQVPAPELKGLTWRFSQGGTPHVDTPDSTLGINQYCEYEGGYLVRTKDSDNYERIEKMDIADVVNNVVSPEKVKTVALESFKVAFKL